MTERVGSAAWGTVAALLLMIATVPVASAEGAHVGSEAEVIADGGANLREGPGLDASVVTLVGEARYVFVQAGPEGGWYRVEYDGAVGWVHGSLLGPARPRTTSRGDAVGRRSDERPPSDAPAGVRVGAEARVAVAEGVNLRREPSTAAGVVDQARNTGIVYVREGPRRTDDGLWYQVDFDGSIGWVMGTFLGPLVRGAAEAAQTNPEPAPARPEAAAKSETPPAKPEAAPAKPEAAPKPETAQPKLEAVAKPEPAPPKSEEPAAKAAPPPRPRGEVIAQRALGLVGLPYAWGGSSPRTGFDCSGLIAYVMAQFGIYPGRTADAQAGAGVSVTGGNLQAGDIVVFANTYAGGYSHTGIYVGGGRFVHAEDYGTGVVVSSVFGGYWGRHYAGARRAW